MKRWMISILTASAMFLSACSAEPDLILQNDESAEEEISSGDGAAQAESAAGEEESSNADPAITSGDEDPAASVVFVYICGAVNSPGVYELEEGERIYRLVELAGGLSEDADERSVNLAQTVEDGEMVYIPTVEESEAAAEIGSETAEAAAQAEESAGKVNINTATADELTVLNGIGEMKAAAIVAYREEHGSFQSIEEIMQVDGIAEATYNKIKDEITV
ncbi:MAG: helix-hairpin-helix domain-containing protein [Clostridiales bacterium]|nr:helix-hairpin-helix domain-containing protein [Clostridiales bacterium]